MRNRLFVARQISNALVIDNTWQICNSIVWVLLFFKPFLYIPKLLYSLSLSQTWIFLIFLTPVAIPVIQHCEFGNQRNTSHMELFFFIIGVLYQIYQPISNLTYSFLVRHTIFGHLP